MNVIRKLTLRAGAGALALAVVAGPAYAETEVVVLAAEETEEAPAEEDGRPAVAEGPRDLFALALLGTMIAGGALAWRNMRRQISGERPQATGEFRWR